MNRRNLFLIIFLGLVFCHCKDPYFPQVDNKPLHYLVVEGYITSDTTTVIKLSRTRSISRYDTAQKIAETHANVFVEDDHGDVYPLSEATDGIYEMNAVYMNPSFKYRVDITLSNGKKYLSDFVPFEQSPAMNGIDWAVKADGLQVYINTVGQPNESPFYRWEISGTWEYHTMYTSGLKYDDILGKVIPRSEDVHICWISDNPSNIILGSSAKEKNNVIHSPLMYFPDHDRRLNVKYSAYITQYSLDSAGWNFWQAMKKNTEEVGSIFDSQPDQTPGNIHCTTDSSEIVVGYIGAGNTTRFRGFIDNRVLPSGWNQPESCTTLFIPTDSVAFYSSYGYVLLYNAFRDPKNGYTTTFKECGDCTWLGTNVKPPFWQ